MTDITNSERFTENSDSGNENVYIEVVEDKKN